VSSAPGNPQIAAAEPPASPQATPAPRPATTPVALATADSSLEKQSASMQMLLLVMAGALALAGITASLVFRFARANATAPEIRGDRRAIWDQVHAERSSPSIFPNEDMPIWRNKVAREVPRDPRAPDDPERRVTEMLARLARSAQT
jgi:predicted HAD superfamily Cof-like phosphohydrolase